jgi:DNA replication protein DnaC
MVHLDFSRTKALSSIPEKKKLIKISELTQSCLNCSDKNLDSLCRKCNYKLVAINRYAESNIPIEYWDINMEDHFVGDKMLFQHYKDLTDDIKNTFLIGKSKCFAGKHGTGKTFTTCCILKKAVLKGYTGLYSTMEDIISVFTCASNEDRFLAKKELTLVDFLVIDELDPRFVSTEQSSNLFGRAFENVIRTRAQNKLPTYICTNSPNVIETFSGSIKASIDSLMNGYVETVIVLGLDFRKGDK